MRLTLFVLFCMLISLQNFAQTSDPTPMQNLDFLIGNWVGTSKALNGDSILSEIPAHQNIQYKLDGSIITIDLASESLSLHTVITYDDAKQCYLYHSFSKNGARIYEARLNNGRLVVTPNDEVRFIFSSFGDGGFREYGEKKKDGKWIKYFEDTFVDIQ